jgi:branched-chain amino acid transport system permease protein
VFTILQTVLSMQTELWQLYTGALFVASVMFFPGGLAGVMVAHVPVLHSGGAGRLIRPYLLTLLPAAICILSVVGLCEMLNAARTASVGEHVITLFWMRTDIHDPLIWGALMVAALGGFWGARRQAKALGAEWHQVVMNPA